VRERRRRRRSGRCVGTIKMAVRGVSPLLPPTQKMSTYARFLVLVVVVVVVVVVNLQMLQKGKARTGKESKNT
jgi:uncharacterized membrane protein YhaH (DUF805 family)